MPQYMLAAVFLLEEHGGRGLFRSVRGHDSHIPET